jgi:hypothetical protein
LSVSVHKQPQQSLFTPIGNAGNEAQGLYDIMLANQMTGADWPNANWFDAVQVALTSNPDWRTRQNIGSIAAIGSACQTTAETSQCFPHFHFAIGGVSAASH